MVQALPEPRPLLLQLPHTLMLQVTREPFAALAAANRDLRLERIATRELIVNPPTGGETGRCNFSITTQLGIWVEANNTLGTVFDSSTGCELPNGANRSPDASWICQECWNALTPAQWEG